MENQKETQRSEENKTVTIYDIAREAGVSAATVSRVMRNSAKVNPEKKAKILQLIETYNYKPSAMARNLSETHTKVIGIIAADVRNPFYAEVFVACETAAANAGYTVLLYNSYGQRDQEERQMEALQEQRVDGMILLGGRVDELVSNLDYVKQLNRINIPVVVNGKLDGSNSYQVMIDDRASMEMIIDYLMSLGHREIAFVGGRSDVLSTFYKMQTYQSYLLENHLNFRPEFLRMKEAWIPGGYNYKAGYEDTNEVLDGPNHPTAVIAVNDNSAAGVVRSIIEHGYRIPEDISVVSYDNTQISRLMTPQLTSVDYDYEQLGRTMVETVIGAIEGKELPRLQIIRAGMIVRESSGPVSEN